MTVSGNKLNLISAQNPTHPTLSFLALLLTALLPGVSSAESSDANIEPEQRWYQIEVLIYEQQRSDIIDEQFPEFPALVYPVNWHELMTPEEYEASLAEADATLTTNVYSSVAEPRPTQQTSPQTLPEETKTIEQAEMDEEIPFIKLANKHKSFLEITKHLRWKKQRVLFHEAWRQPFIQHNTAIADAVLVRGGQQFGEHYELEGSISLHLTRYLHFSTNLWVNRFMVNDGSVDQEFILTLPSYPEKIQETTPGESTIDLFSLLEDDQDDEILFSETREDTTWYQQPYLVSTVHPMKQSRRMRSNEVHYIDHPDIGIMVRIIPFEIPESEQQENADQAELTPIKQTSLTGNT
jgi:hypothetical protein